MSVTTQSCHARPVVDFDHQSEQHAADAPAAFRSLRQNSPVAWSEHHGGFWVITRYRDVFACLRDPATFTSGRFINADGQLDGGIAIPPLPFRMVPDETDLPEWEAPRMLLSRALGPKMVVRFRDRARAVAVSLIDRHIASGSMDLVLHLANPLPAILTMELVGLPLDRWEAFADPFHAFPASRPGSVERQRAAEGIEWICGEISALAAERRKSPRQDLASAIVHGQLADGAPFTHEEAVEILVQVVAGGVDTTTSLTANAFWHLHAFRRDRERLIAEPGLLSLATEEFLRFYSPVQNEGRTVSRSVDVGGQEIPAGARVLLSLASANRDPEAFEDPESFIIDRAENLHAGFGLGIHRCVGSHFARLQFEIMVEAALARIPNYEVNEADMERYSSIGAVNGWGKMPVTFTPGLPSGSPDALGKGLG